MTILLLFLYISFYLQLSSFELKIESQSIEPLFSSSHDHSILNYSAFCQDIRYYRNRNFPTEVPEHHIPWIWEAIHDPVKAIVDISTMSRYPCAFDKNQWKEMIHLFPNHSHQLAFGLESNILVPVDYPYLLQSYIKGKQMICEFLYHSKVVFTIDSYKIRGKDPYAKLGTIQIRCPTPTDTTIKWNRIQIRLQLLDGNEYPNNMTFSNVTVDVPVCKIPTYRPREKKYGLSICTATNRLHREHLIEWIEYHKLVGVDHIYLYYTSTIESINQMMTLLQSYINEEYITIIPWPFSNCVRNMGKGRFSRYKNKESKSIEFRPPKPITQYGALASCYTRFKHTSKYITYIDDDEFLAFSANHIAHDLGYKHLPNHLLSISDAIFHKYSRSSAIRFEPITFLPCNTTPGIEHIPYNAIEYPISQQNVNRGSISTPLPRLGVWSHSKRHMTYECKLIMRTDVVGMFYIHYVSLTDSNIDDHLHRPNHQQDSFTKRSMNGGYDSLVTLPLTHLSLLHYKYPAALSDNIIEGFWPRNPLLFESICEKSMQNKDYNRIYHAQIPNLIGTQLKENYLKRVGK